MTRSVSTLNSSAPKYQSSLVRALLPAVAIGLLVAIWGVQGDIGRWFRTPPDFTWLVAGLVIAVTVLLAWSLADYSASRASHAERERMQRPVISFDGLRQETIVILPEDLAAFEPVTLPQIDRLVIAPEDVAETVIPVLGQAAMTLQPDLIGEDIARCPFCGGPLHSGGPLTECSACHTPHHAECWQAAGGCTTFGCENGHS